jgi:hypothetical protein
LDCVFMIFFFQTKDKETSGGEPHFIHSSATMKRTESPPYNPTVSSNISPP